MKLFLLGLALLAGSPGLATAQTTDASAPAVAAPSTTPADSAAGRARRPWLMAGLTAGGTYSSFLGSDASIYNTKYKLGYQGGLMADLRLTDHLALHPELLYVLKGSDFEAAARNRRLTYLDMPVLVRYYTGAAFSGNSFYAEAGPQASYLLTAKNEDKKSVKAEFNTWALNFVLGAGYRLGNGLSLGLRYDVGVTDIYQPVPAATSFGRGDFQQNTKSDVFSLLLGYSFGHR